MQCQPHEHAWKCPSKPAFGYVIPSQVQPYLDLAKAYGWANYMFQTNQGPSYPAHQYLFGATSAPSADDDHNGIFAAENSGERDVFSPKTSTVPLINPRGVEFTYIYPCFEHQTLADLLDALRYIVALLWCQQRRLGRTRRPSASR